MNLLIALKLGINKSVQNNLLGNEMNTRNTTLSSVGYATTPLLLGRYSLTLSTSMGIYSLDTVNSTGDRQSGYCQLCWGTCSAEERLCQPLGDEDSWLGIRFLWPATKNTRMPRGNYSVWIHRPGLSTFKAILNVFLCKSSAKATIMFIFNMFCQKFGHFCKQTNKWKIKRLFNWIIRLLIGRKFVPGIGEGIRKLIPEKRWSL